MQVLSVHLRNFRNYSDLYLTVGKPKNILIGKNGQGKTNFLEALYFLSHCRSHRTGTDRELIHQGSDFATLSAELASVFHPQDRVRVDVHFQLGEKNRLKTLFKMNGVPLQSRSQLLGTLPSVSFFLSDLLLLRGAPRDRRDWLDAAAIQWDKKHFLYLSDFQRIKNQKNALLKQPMERLTPEHLTVWNQQFALAGARLVLSRLAYLRQVRPVLIERYQSLSQTDQERLAMVYESGWLEETTDEGDSLEVLEQQLLKALEEKVTAEIRRGTSLVGPHRDDLVFLLARLNAADYASQGQQRSIVLALKFAELELLTKKLGEAPLLLLDDVMAELDPHRQKALLEKIEGQPVHGASTQVFLTTTHLDTSLQPFLQCHQPQNDLNIFQVEGGTVRLKEESVAHGF